MTTRSISAALGCEGVLGCPAFDATRGVDGLFDCQPNKEAGFESASVRTIAVVKLKSRFMERLLKVRATKMLTVFSVGDNSVLSLERVWLELAAYRQRLKQQLLEVIGFRKVSAMVPLKRMVLDRY